MAGLPMRNFAERNNANRVGLAATDRAQIVLDHLGMRHSVTMQKVVTACRLDSGGNQREQPKNSDK